VRALGFERVVTVDAYDVKAVEATLKEFVKADGPSVLNRPGANARCCPRPDGGGNRCGSWPKRATAAPCASASAARPF